MAMLDRVLTEGLDERGLANPGNSRDPDPHRVPRPGKQCIDEGGSANPVVGQRRLDECDGLRKRASIAASDARG